MFYSCFGGFWILAFFSLVQLGCFGAYFFFSGLGITFQRHLFSIWVSYFLLEALLLFSRVIIFLHCIIMSYNKVDSFHIRFIGKNYSAWKFQFKLFVKGKELWGHIDESTLAPREVEALSK